ncbi:hypothetical protein [Klebsiella pneumoniae]|uniref:hypothetical protein n=1 Tax=Klebsiella pneumoniae TaxID=573 RepID=UPI0027B93C5B|nr:hypothetical protein [Klebsiella pneumoniae]
MTITLQAVNELIASLESAGELSIREQKFLKLAKEFRICSASLDAAIKTGNVLADQNSQLAAENAALKDINAWCKTDAFKNMYREFKTAEAIGCSDVDCMHDAMLVAIMHAPATPATARIVAGIKAEAKSHDLNAFISHYSAELDNHIANGGDQFDERAVRLRSVIVGARMFREKLRDEEKALALREGADK